MGKYVVVFLSLAFIVSLFIFFYFFILASRKDQSLELELESVKTEEDVFISDFFDKAFEEKGENRLSKPEGCNLFGQEVPPGVVIYDSTCGY